MADEPSPTSDLKIDYDQQQPLQEEEEEDKQDGLQEESSDIIAKHHSSQPSHDEVSTSSTDDKSVRSRVFIGHLSTDRALRSDLHKLFSKCGKVVALSLLNGYGFVQYDCEESALKCIDEIHGTPYLGRRLVVDKPSAWKILDGEDTNEQRPWPKEPKQRFSPERNERNDRNGYRYDSERRERERRRERRHQRLERRRYEEMSSPSRHRYDDITPPTRHRYDDMAPPTRHRYDDDVAPPARHRYDDMATPTHYHDPYYERYLEMRYMESRLAERYELQQYYDRYASTSDYRLEYTRRERDYNSSHDEGQDRYMISRYDRPRDDIEARRRPFDDYYQ